MVERNENGGERHSANWHLERLREQSPLEVTNVLGDIAIENEEDLPEVNEGPTLVAPSGVPIGRRFKRRKFIRPKNQKLLIY